MTFTFTRIYLLAFALFVIFSPTAKAATISASKPWTITFSNAVQQSTLNDATIYIQTPTGNVHPTQISSINESTIQITPLIPYVESGTYSIVVNDVQDTKNTVVTPFTHTFTFTAVPKATWIWNAYHLTEEDAQFLIDQHVTKVYVQIESELPYDAYIPFFETLQSHHIAIYALEGFAGLQFQDEQKTTRFLNWVIPFQQQYNYFTGIHLDIEPYTDPSWQWNEQQLLTEYFTYVQRMQMISQNEGWRFEIDIPFWFDELTYTNTFGTGNVAHWLIDHSDEVTIMAYRNKAAAIFPLIANEFAYAQSKKKPMTIALETAQSYEGDFLSFYDTSSLALYDAMHVLHDAYHSTIALHYLPAWQALLQR